jgi:hypothetical protein
LLGLQLLHTPLLQPPVAHDWQPSPPLPHAVSALPGMQTLPLQQPLAQLVPSQVQAPATQCWPARQAAPGPQPQVPSAAQPSLINGSHARQAAPAVPQVAALGVVQTPVAQQPLGQVEALHAFAPSRRQVDEQPSSDVVLPSSHSSMPERTTPSPQIAGSPSVSETPTSWPSCTANACWSLPTTSPLATSPSTRRSTVIPARLSGSSTAAVSCPLVSGRGGLGSVPVGNAVWSPSVPEIRSEVRFSRGS